MAIRQTKRELDTRFDLIFISILRDILGIMMPAQENVKESSSLFSSNSLMYSATFCGLLLEQNDFRSFLFSIYIFSHCSPRTGPLRLWLVRSSTNGLIWPTPVPKIMIFGFLVLTVCLQLG